MATQVHAHGLGEAYKRKEDARFIRGQGKYVDDVQLPGMVYGKPITPPVRVAILDKYDNVATSYGYVVYCLMGNDGSPGKNANLDPSGNGRAATAGIATFENLKIDQLGVGYTLYVAGTGVHRADSQSFDVLVTLA